MEKRYRVTLAGNGNVDHGQNPFASLEGVPSGYSWADSLEHASIICRRYIEDYQLGSGNWNGGDVYEADTKVARISYNGRIWIDGKSLDTENMDITQNGQFITVDGETAPKNDVIVELMDYGDEHFDIHFKKISTDLLFGKSAMCAIHTRERAEQYAQDYAYRGGVTWVTVKDLNWDSY